MVVGAGSSLSFRLPNQVEAGLDVRLAEERADAYVWNFSGAHWRSVELLLRVGSWR